MEVSLKRSLALIAAVAVGLFAWNSWVVYPLKLLVVLIHESGHAVAAMLAGGKVESITIDRLEGGLCTYRFEPTFLHLVMAGSAGYLGSALVGAALLWVTLRYRSGRWVLALLSLGLLGVGVLWARSPFTFAVAVGMSLALGLVAKLFPAELSQLLAFFIGVFCSLYALFDLKDDLWNAERRMGTDAALLAKATHVPSVVWAALWTLVAIGLLVLAIHSGTRGHRPDTELDEEVYTEPER